MDIFTAGSLTVLADALAEQLSTPLGDPMQAELVAVPSVGMQRWLKLRLAATLGADGHGDGIAANINMPFPGVLRSQLFGVDRGDAEDPWRLSRMTFALHHVLVQNLTDPELGAVTKLPAGATWYGRARRIADLFDRYGTRRPEMLRHWAKGSNTDSSGESLRPEFLWQPALFRMLREFIGIASPAERLPDILRGLQANTIALDLPSRFAIFGVSTLPGGQGFADILRAFGEHRQVGLYMLDPAPLCSNRLRQTFDGNRELKRAEDTSANEVRSTLLRSWGRSGREAQLLLPRLGMPEPTTLGPIQAGPNAGSTILGTLQAAIVADVQPAPSLVPSETDKSIQIHACPGNGRQIEVLRDAILAELRDNPTLEESDILVVCPDLETFAPLIPGALGPTAERVATGWSGPPRLRYTISDRDLPAPDSVNEAIIALVALAGGRYPATEVMDFLSLPPVADAYMFDSDDLEMIENWLGATEVRWGLNEENRVRQGLPGLTANSWKHGLDQLLIGMAIQDDDLAMGPQRIPAAGVEGSGVATLSRLVSLITRLARIDDQWSRPASIAVWASRLSEAVVDFFQVPFHDAWQIERARTSIADALADAEVVGAESVQFSLNEISQLLEERLVSGSSRPRFFDGGVTFTSLRPLRGVPHRLICILGLDEGALVRSSINGDDLLAVKPDIGDPDRRSDQRQALLETVLAAQDKLILTRSGSNLKSNAPEPPSIAVAELLSAIEALILPEEWRRVRDQIEHTRPRHSFDPVNFSPVDPFSFDERARTAAVAKLTGANRDFGWNNPTPLAPPEPASMADVRLLHGVLKDAPRMFFSQRLSATFRQKKDGLGDNIPTGGDHLLNWATLDDLISTARREKDLDPRLEILRARGSFPPGPAGEKILDERLAIAKAVTEELHNQGGSSAREVVPIEIMSEWGPIVASIAGVDIDNGIGPVSTSASEMDGRFRRKLWLDLCLLTAAIPSEAWIAIGVTRKKNGGDTETVRRRVRGTTAREREGHAIRALQAVQQLVLLGMTEPLPIWAKLVVSESTVKNWGNSYGIATDVYARAAFGVMSTSEIHAVQARPTDPGDPGQPSRIWRLHAYIEDLIKHTTEVA